jgi:hypothetical protein
VNVPGGPPLKFLHSAETLNPGKIEHFARWSTAQLRASLKPGEPGSLKVRPDGTILDGHHRIKVLADRGENVDTLPREIIEKSDES